MHERDMSNDELLAALAAAGREEDAVVARVIGLLMEVEERRLHLRLACPSMFAFCVQKLGMSEGEAYRRITVARLAKRFPRILDALRARRVHLSSLALLRDVMTPENAAGLLEQVAGKTTRAVEELVATLAPRPDVRPMIRKLPERKPGSAMAANAATPANVATPTPTLANAHVAAAPAPATPALASSGMTPASPATPTRPAPARRERQLQPLAESRHRVQFTASSALRERLERAQSLMRHRNLDGDLAVVVERAMDLLIAQLEKQKLAATKRPKPAGVVPIKARRVTAAARREVVKRDGEQCAFVGENGERCPARERLEIDHRQPLGRGGGHHPSNLRLLCRDHNVFAAERVYGREHIARAIDLRRRKQTSRCPTPSSLPIT